MLLVSGVSSLLTYLAGLAIVHQFDPSNFSAYSATASLLMIVGIVTTSMQQWPIATLVTKGYLRGARRLAFFGLGLIGPAIALVAAFVVSSYATWQVTIAAAASAYTVTAGATAAGYLQALRSNRTMAALRLVEALGRSAIMVIGALLAVTWVAVGAIVVGTGSFTLLAILLSTRRSTRNRITVVNEKSAAPAPVLRTAFSGLALQGLGTLLTSVAVLAVVTSAVGASEVIGGYQAITVLTRVPVLIAGALALVMFVPLTKGQFSAAWNSLSFYIRAATVVAFTVITLPVAIYGPLLSSHANGWSFELVLALAASGWFGGLVLLLTAAAQARSVVRGPVVLLLLAVFINANLGPFLWQRFGALGMAMGDATVMAATVVALAITLSKHAPRMLTAFTSLSWVLVGVPLAMLSALSSQSRFMLLIYVLFAGCLGIASLIQRSHPQGDVKHMRILHLAYEDPNQPGAGGGSVHSHEVDERLTQLGHTVIALHRRYPGAKTRVENGVTWRPLGIGRFADRWLKASTVLYFLALPFALPFLIAKYNPDVIMDDFGAPISSLPLRWFTTHPLVGVAQWADAAGKTKQYGLPFAFIEKLGFASHKDIIAVSEDLAISLRTRAKHATVHVIPNGVPDEAREPRQPVTMPGWNAGKDVMFLGRLESPQKGLDTLIEAWALVKPNQPKRNLWIVGDGPDREALEKLSKRLDLVNEVHFVGRINGGPRLDMLADAALVVMPSHYETFGMVAAEALAVGTPVVVTDIDSLRDFVTEETGLAVKGHNPKDWAMAIEAGLNPAQKKSAKTAGPALVAKFDWNLIARDIEQVLAASRRFTTIETHEDDSALARAFKPENSTLLVGNYGNGNTGDEAILARLLEFVPKNTKVTVASRNPSNIVATHGVNSVSLMSLAGMRTWMKAKRVVVGGGGMFGPGQPILISILPAVLLGSKLLGKSIAFAGVGVYQGMPRFSKFLLGLAASAAEPSLVRDDASTRTLDLRFGARKLELIPDAGFGLTPDDDAARHLLNEQEFDAHRPLLLISPKAGLDTTLNERSVRSLAAAVRRWHNKGGQVGMLLLSAGSEFGLGRAWSDRVLALKIAALAEVPVMTFGPNLTPKTAKALVGFADAIVGMRFHALVFAVSTGTPVASLTFEEKSRSLLGKYGGFNVLPEDWNENALDAWIDQVIFTRVSQSDDLVAVAAEREIRFEPSDSARFLPVGGQVIINRTRCTEPKLSIVMPSYNTDPEELRSTVERAFKIAGEFGEVVIVDDGSTNNSPELLHDMPGPLLLVHQPNAGKGAALRTGMALARGTWVGTIDADGDYAPEELPSLVEAARARGDLVAVGHRDLAHAGYEPFRFVASWAFRLWTKLWLSPGVSDTEAGIKVFSGQLIPLLLPELAENAFAIDVDIFAALERLGMTSAEGPVSFVHDDHTTVTLRRGAMAFVGVVRVALRHHAKEN